MSSCNAFAQKRYDGYAQVRLEYSTLVSHIPRIHVHRTITYVTSDDLRIAHVHICTYIHGPAKISRRGAALSLDYVSLSSTNRRDKSF